MRKGLKQLCVSDTENGRYDEQILDLICSGECEYDIMITIMTLSRGHENPAIVQWRITELRK